MTATAKTHSLHGTRLFIVRMHRGNINFQFLKETYLLNTQSQIFTEYSVTKDIIFIHQTNLKSGNFNEFF